MFEQILIQDRAFSQRLASRGHGRFLRHFAWLLARTGDGWLWFVMSLLLIWQRRPLGWTLALAITLAAVIVAIAKGIFRRSRPSGPGRALATDKYAFPSGHAARVGAVSAVLASAGGWALLLLVWAIAVSLARVVLARHYLSDVAVGLALGLLLGLGLTAVIF